MVSRPVDHSLLAHDEPGLELLDQGHGRSCKLALLLDQSLLDSVPFFQQLELEILLLQLFGQVLTVGVQGMELHLQGRHISLVLAGDGVDGGVHDMLQVGDHLLGPVTTHYRNASSVVEVGQHSGGPSGQ